MSAELFDSDFTEAPFPDVCIHHRFEYQAGKHPEATAVAFEADRLTYRELNQKANQLARYLQHLGVEPGTLIGLFVEKSLDVITGILGILKNGCGYVPMDPVYPEERLQHMIEDSASPVILTLSHLKKMLPQTKAQVVCIDSDWNRISEENPDNPESNQVSQSLAYVIFTSGSTGKPKGVCCHHRGVMNLLADFQNRQSLGPGDICSWWTSLNFDVSVYEIFSPLMAGAALTIVPESVRADAPTLMDWLHQEKVTSAYLPPFMVADLDVWVRKHPGKSMLRRLLVGVEAIPERLLNAIDQAVPNLRVINGYGPTEATVCATLYTISPENELHENTPIGRPVQNMQIHLLDETGQEVPAGSPGKVYIGGIGVANGYLNRPDLTAESFVPDTFSDKSEDRLYRTGDLARLMPDGNIGFIGRADFQVKFHGFRVELGEIEVQLRKHPAIREAVVLVLEDIPGIKRLVAYLVCYEGKEVTLQELRETLQKSLPDYMVPSIFVVLNRIPMTPNGKTDRSALPAPSNSNQLIAVGHEYREPQTPVEKKLARFFAEVLHTDRIGLDDSFFELGGHSLLATQVMSRIRESFKVDFPVSAIFKAPTVETLARFVNDSGHQVQSTDLPPIVHVEDRKDAPLSFSQLRQWYLDQLEPGTPAYNIPLAYRLKGPLDETAMVKAFEKIINRHQGLRTIFKKQGGQPVQIIEPPQPFEPEIIDLEQISEARRETEVQTLCSRECHRGFDLTKGHLLRVLLLRLGEDDHVLMLTVHHIVSDGWSMGVIFREFMALYNDYASDRTPDLPGLPIQYTDFARWQRKWMESEIIRPQIDYWKHQLEGLPEGLDLPTDRPRPAVQSYRGASQSLILDKNLCKAMTSLTRKKGVTLFMLMLAGLKTLLYRYTHQEDISVGTFIANRNRAEIEGLVGFFINTLVMRTNLSDNPTFETLLERVRETALGAYAHQDLPFEKLLDEVKPERNLSRTPLFQVLMVLQNMPLPPLDLPGMMCKPIELETFRSNFDLTLWLYERGDEIKPEVEFEIKPEVELEIKMVLDYSTDLFDESSVKQMLTCLRNLLIDATNDPSLRLSDLSVLAEEQRETILSQWSGAAHYKPGPDTGVQHLFEDQALKRPDAIALIQPLGKKAEDRQISYQNLNRDANKVAHFLRQHGAGPETFVGILMERSPDLIKGIMGILKTGSAYIPIDRNYPAERIAFILNDTRSPVVLTDSNSVQKIEDLAGSGMLKEPVQIVVMDRDSEKIIQESEENPSEGSRGNNLAYAIYTSGSTGQPKGVLIEHRALSAFVDSAVQEYGIGPHDRILQFASPSFDASIEEIFTSLTTGATLILRSDEMIRSIPAFVQACHDNELTVVDLPTAFWHQLTSALGAGDLMLPPTVRLLIIGGEEALSDKVAAWHKVTEGKIRLMNTYGPTETTVVATVCDLSDLKMTDPSDGKVPIGHPLPHLKAFILDNHGGLVPDGVSGELHIGGSALARGYLNRPELTDEKFIPDPFSRETNARLYKTGDMARFLPQGNIEFLGRADRQVKVRGFRVELAEIESTLNRFPEIKESAVVAHEESNGILKLIAYIVPHETADPDTGRFRQQLKPLLPDYMIPHAFVILEKLPVTGSGKLDTKALPDPEPSSLDHEKGFKGPRNPIENILEEIWCQVFDLEQVGIDNNFFDLGGHSLLSIEIIDRINKAGLWLTPEGFIQNPTIEALAEVVSTARPSSQNRDGSSLVELQPQGTRSPLYFIHSTPGDVLGYMNLINHLGYNQPCFGFQSLGLQEKEKAHTTVEEMAAYYVQQMFSFQPEGPYYLAGWCYGGIVAAEMAIQVREMQHRVAMLILIETPFPKSDFGRLHYYADRLSGFLKMGPRQWLLYARNTIKYRMKVKKGEIDSLFSLHLSHGPLANRDYVYRLNTDAEKSYRMHTHPGCPIRLFAGTDLKEGFIPDPQNLWAKTSKDIKTFLVPGNHLTILKEPNVDILAKQLSTCLD